MFEVIYMKADYEPWWMFEDWEQMIQMRKTFEDKEEAKQYLDELNTSFSVIYEFHEMRKDRFYAYWSLEERVFCEGCDENLQIFHGIISFQDGEPAPIIVNINSNI